MTTAQPLAGRRLLVTRRAPQARGLTEALAALGAEVVELPLLDVAPPADPRALDSALEALADDEWIAFASANAVEAVRARLEARDLTLLRRVRFASVGEATTKAILSAFPGRRVELEPASEFGAAGLLTAFALRGCTRAKVLLPRSEIGRDELEKGLLALGADVRAVTAYRVVSPPGLPTLLAEVISKGLDAAFFASPSAVSAYRAVCGEEGLRVPAIVIGTTTEASAKAAGLTVAAVARSSTVASLVEATVQALTRVDSTR